MSEELARPSRQATAPPAGPGAAADPPRWPGADEARVVLLLDARNRGEQRLLEQWIEENRPAGAPAPARLRLGSAGGTGQLEAELASEDDPLMAPLRVAWLPPLRDGERTVRFTDLLTLSDPREPGWLRQEWIHRSAPDRCRVIVAEPARAQALRARWREAGGSDPDQATGLAEFVERQALLALERAERRRRGARYKVPRLVHEEILGRPAFRAGVARLARLEERGPSQLMTRASRLLREIAATHSPFVIDLVARLIRRLYRQGYGESLQYDRAELDGIATLMQRHPVVFLPSHKSNLDHLVLQAALHENGMPPNHTAGGINMNFFPVGPLVRRSGVFFIRRSFKDDELYKHVLRSYVDYLVEKRFSLEWYIEGGRSRSGKLLPPRFGMLAYVAESYLRGKTDDVMLVPVAIAYDQIADVGAYSAEQQGAEKEREGFGWFVRMVRSLRRRYGSIHIRFGDPVSMRDRLGPQGRDEAAAVDERSLALQKLAFEVCDRINRVTPITPVSLVTLALLGVGDRAVSVDEAREAVRELMDYVRQRKFPVTRDVDALDTHDGTERALEALRENDVVTRFDEGREPVYRIGADQQLQAAYYRNTIVHFFLGAAIAEVALVRAAFAGTSRGEGAAAQDLWDETLRVRDLLKFDFFFADKAAFREEMRAELARFSPSWEKAIEGGAEATIDVLRERGLLVAPSVLRPFLEAYRVVADLLALQPPEIAIDRDELVQECLGLGRQYALQRRIHGADSISKVLFQTALKLAENRGLLDSDARDLSARRALFADELAGLLKRVEGVAALAASRRAGLSR